MGLGEGEGKGKGLGKGEGVGEGKGRAWAWAGTWARSLVLLFPRSGLGGAGASHGLGLVFGVRARVAWTPRRAGVFRAAGAGGTTARRVSCFPTSLRGRGRSRCEGLEGPECPEWYRVGG